MFVILTKLLKHSKRMLIYLALFLALFVSAVTTYHYTEVIIHSMILEVFILYLLSLSTIFNIIIAMFWTFIISLLYCRLVSIEVSLSLHFCLHSILLSLRFIFQLILFISIIFSLCLLILYFMILECPFLATYQEWSHFT